MPVIVQLPADFVQQNFEALCSGKVSIPNKCPLCEKQNCLVHRDFCFRKCYLPDRDSITVRRVSCKECDAVMRLLPPFVIPFRRYGQPVIKEALEQCEDGVAPEEVRLTLRDAERHPDSSTVRRWIKTFCKKVNYRLCMAKELRRDYISPSWNEKSFCEDSRDPTRPENFPARSDGSTSNFFEADG